MNNQELANKILELVGGQANVASATHCMTRLRLNVNDDSKIQLDALKKTEGVLGVVEDETLQVVLGPGKVNKVYDEFIKLIGDNKETTSGATADWQANKQVIKGKQKDNSFKRGLRTIGNIFIPLLPAIIAAGLFNGFGNLIGEIWKRDPAFIAATGGPYIVQQLFLLFGGGFLTYFAIYTGINAAKEFGATPALGGMLGGISIGAQIITLSTALGLYNADVPLDSILTTGKGGIIGIILGAWVLAKVEKAIRKVVPDVLDLILTPFLSILIVGSLYVLVLMPITGWLSDGLVWVLSLLINSTNPVINVISGYVLAAVFLPMVLLGLHHGLIPIYAVQLEQLGKVTLFPILAMAGAGQVGASIAIYFKAKKVGNLSMKKTIIGALPAGFLGVGEPLIYGVTLPIGKSFITAGLGAGFGGAFVAAMGVGSSAWGPSGLVAIPLMTTPMAMLYYFIGLVISYIMGFIITWFGIKSQDVVGVE